MTLFAAALLAVVLAPQSCSYSAQHSTLTFGPDMDAISVTLSATCPWTAKSSVAWLAVNEYHFPSGYLGSLALNVSANTSGVPRVGQVLVAGQPVVTVTQGTTPCMLSITPASLRFPREGGTATATMITTTPDCARMPRGTAAWFSSGFPGFVGSGALTVTAEPNPASRRTASAIAGGLVLAIDQDGSPCDFSLSPAATTVPAHGGSVSLTLLGTGVDCRYSAETFRSIGESGAIFSSGQSGTAPATLAIFIPANTRNVEVTHRIVVGNAQTIVTQAPAPVVTDVTALGFGIWRRADGSRYVSPAETFRISDPDGGNIWHASSVAGVVVTPLSARLFQVSIDPDALSAAAMLLQPLQIRLSATNPPYTAQSIFVHIASASAEGGIPPFGSFDTPGDGATALSGAIPVTGWVLDDIGVQAVQIFREPVAGEGAGDVFIGNALRVRDARPDIAVMPRPERRIAGWGYMLLSNVLPDRGNGTFAFKAYAIDLEGQATLLGRKVVTIDNAHAIQPFGTIDIPAHGDIVSGTIVVHGWVLTPSAKTIPIDGSTIHAYIDGLPIGSVGAYNIPRPDVQAFFPGLSNSDGPGATLTFDTTTIADGVHTIAWVVYDSAGVGAGIGSRYFTVSNSGKDQ